MNATSFNLTLWKKKPEYNQVNMSRLTELEGDRPTFSIIQNCQAIR